MKKIAKKVIIILTIFCATVTGQERNSTFTSIFNKNFNNGSEVAKEFTSFEEDKYSHIKCNTTYRYSKMKCDIISEHFNQDTDKTSNKQQCTLFAKLADSEAFLSNSSKVQLHTMRNGIVISGYNIDVVTKDPESREKKRIVGFKFKIRLVDMNECHFPGKDIVINLMIPSVYILPYTNTFDVIATSRDLPKCKQNYCKFTFDSDGNQVNDIVKLVTDELGPVNGINYAENMFIYSIHPKSSAKGYFVMNRHEISQNKYFKIFTFNPDGSKLFGTDISKDLMSNDDLKDAKWSKHDNTLLICTAKYKVHCIKLDETLNVRLNTKFKISSNFVLNSVYTLSTGEIVLWTIKAINETYNCNKVYVTDNQLSEERYELIEFNDRQCNQQSDNTLVVTNEIYEMKNQFCLSIYCKHRVPKESSKHRWNVKCIDKV